MDPERYLSELEPVGWKLGLERMRALLAELGHPQQGYESLHVVGTNGKTSVALWTAALLEKAGLRAGATVSPHATSWSERTRIGGEPVAAAALERAVAEVAAAIATVETRLEGERVTQFEAAVAASFVVFREATIDVAVVEAGLGGRLDATNVIPSRATALTSVSLDHTDWLGETTAEIAAEKLAVLRPGSVLVLGSLEPALEAQARRHAAGIGAQVVVAADPDPAVVPPDLAPFLRRNAAVAIGLAATATELPPPAQLREALESVLLPGRAQRLGGSPPLIVDAAHNEEGAQALAEALPGLAGGGDVHACVAILADKDIAAFAAALAPALASVVCTVAEPGAAMGRPGAGPADPRALAASFRAAGAAADVEPDPRVAVARARARAGAGGGAALCAGSHYLLRYAWTPKTDPSSSR